MQETQVLSLGPEDPLEKGMATHSSVLAWRIPWTEEPGGLQPAQSDMTEQLPLPYVIYGSSLVVQTVKNLPAMWETQAGYLGREDALEKGMATHLSILAWRIPWTEEPGGLQRVGHD